MLGRVTPRKTYFGNYSVCFRKLTQSLLAVEKKKIKPTPNDLGPFIGRESIQFPSELNNVMQIRCFFFIMIHLVSREYPS